MCACVVVTVIGSDVICAPSDALISCVDPWNCSWRVTQLYPVTVGLCCLCKKNKVKVKYVDSYSTSSRSASNALPLPVSRHWSPQANPTARHSANTARPRIRVMYHAICLFTPPMYAGFHSAWAGTGWVGPSAWFRTEVVYSSKDGHPPRH